MISSGRPAQPRVTGPPGRLRSLGVGRAVARSSAGRRPPGSAGSPSGRASRRRTGRPARATNAVGVAVCARLAGPSGPTPGDRRRRARARPPSSAGVADRDQPAAGDDADPVGQRLGLVQVVRGQQDRRAGRRPARGSAPRTRAGPPGRSRSSARRGRAARAGRRCRAPRRGGASGRRRGCGSGRRASRPARPARSPRRVVRRRGRSRRSGATTSPTRQLVELAGALQHDADPGAATPRRRAAGRAPSTRTSPASRGGSPRGSPPWWSCRRRSGRAGRTPRPGRRSRSTPSTAGVAAVRLAQPAYLDRGRDRSWRPLWPMAAVGSVRAAPGELHHRLDSYRPVDYGHRTLVKVVRSWCPRDASAAASGTGRGSCAPTPATRRPPRATRCSGATWPRGRPGCRVAFDLPTQTGYDPDHELAAGEVGRVGRAGLAPRRRAGALRRHRPRRGQHLHDHQRHRDVAARALRRPWRRSRASPPADAGRHDAERHRQGVPVPRHVHLPARTRRCG